MKVLVTGGMGYIGSHTCVQMIEAGMEPVIIDNLCNANQEVLNRIEALTKVKPIFHQGDVRDEAFLDGVFAQHDIAAVIHFAGLKAVGESVAKPLEYYDNNVNGSLVLARCMRKAGVKSLVFSSSATVYGDRLAFRSPKSHRQARRPTHTVAVSTWSSSAYRISLRRKTIGALPCCAISIRSAPIHQAQWERTHKAFQII